ncbi:MAG: DNA-formamidopyrimidine glycosylase, partial [Gammaproteobacteria bacterium]|nr:DNA-formamidopyrimidine glycosylase [Gammaproteobacteria bacterium]
MPELPEVETTRRGIEPHVSGQRVGNVVVRESRLRWPVPGDLSFCLRGQRINALTRRGKYLLFSLDKGTLLVHLGMSGNLRVMPISTPSMKHDHLDIELNNGKLLRFNDPRRFGSVLWTQEAAQEHKLLKNLGPEPLSDAFSGELLYDLSR